MGSFKVTENGTNRKLRYGFLFAFYSTKHVLIAVYLAVSTQYTNVTHRQTPHDGIGRAYA